MIVAAAATASSTAPSIADMIEACCRVLVDNAAHLDALDAAIGDGDHGTNMRRGAGALRARRGSVEELRLPDALVASGEIAVMAIGGAAGPLYGTLLITLGKVLSETPQDGEVARALSAAVDAVARRGRSEAGAKTLLDVLCPLRDAVLRGATLSELAREAPRWAEATRNLRALRGRASFLGERSVGHVDPGAASMALLIAAICRSLEARR